MFKKRKQKEVENQRQFQNDYTQVDEYQILKKKVEKKLLEEICPII